ncbi:MAG TPA: CHAD domain-containing protein [Pyrinomonadaceae bacterium]|nr:CHAD domain-containing protein [Pyrinomonadaceae bacterium]
MAKAKEIEGLDCGRDVGEGVRLVLRTRVEEMCGLRAAALDWSDPEGVHDMRVASRRLRSALRDFSPYLRGRKMRRVKGDLKSLADALGLVRDDDVAIMALDKLAEEAPPEVCAGVGQFTDERKRKRERARARLERALTEDALAELREDFNDALADGVKARRRQDVGGEGRKETSVSFRRAGRKIILARLEEFQDLSASLYTPLKSETLHRLRIAAKRLRYALELFAVCWDESTLTPFAREIAKMQTSLGELHDCDVWVEEIGEGLKRAGREAVGGQHSETTAAGQKRRAAFWLLDHFTKERTHHFHDALARWHEWETTGFQSSLTDAISNKLPTELSAQGNI